MEMDHTMNEKLNRLHLPQKFINKIQHDLAYILSYELEDLQQVILIGSCARGKVKATSDVDWMIVTSSPIEDKSLRHRILGDICDEWNGVSGDLIFTTTQQRLERNTSFMKIVAEDEVILWEREDTR